MTIEDIRKKELAYCSCNVFYFVENYVHIEDKENTVEVVQPFKLWKMQKEALEQLEHNRLNVLLKARQLGITWLVLAYAMWKMLFNKNFLAIGLSRTEEEAKELIRRLTFMLDNMQDLLKDSGITYSAYTLKIEIKVDNRLASTFKAFASSTGAGRSFTADLVIIDEWAFQENARDIWVSAYPVINRTGSGQFIGLSTIKRGTLFEEIFTEDNNFNKIFLPWYADPRRNAEWYQRTKKDLKENIMQEYPSTVEEALTIPGGAYFPEFSINHIVKSRALKQGAYLYASIDYGFDMFAVLFYEIDSKGRVTVYKEIYKNGLIVSEAAKTLRMAKGNDELQYIYAPPDLWNRHSDTGKSTAEIFSEYGLYLTKTSNNREQGAMNIKEYLAEKLFVDEQTGEKILSPILTVMEGTAPNLERCIKKIQKDKNKPNEYANDPHELTHIVDSLRAFACGRPRQAEQEEKNKKHFNFEFEKPKPNASGYGDKIKVI